LANNNDDNASDQDPRPLFVDIDGVRCRTRLTPEERRWFAEEWLAQNRELQRLSSIWAWLFGGNDDTTH
jgi:hypothetical protein